MDRLGTLGELFVMVWRRRTWALLPALLALTVVGALLLLGQATPAGPLLYPLF